MKKILYTVGHSTHTAEHFIGLLKANEIQALVDVRSSPFSKFNPQYNRENLNTLLKNEGISYIFLGKELGARRDEPDCYIDNKVSYSAISKTPAFIEGLKRLESGINKMTVSLMCAEKDPLTCHRTILVARQLTESHIIQHIHADGSLEDGVSAEERLLKEHKLNDDDMFRTREDRLKKAYLLRESRIAYDEKE